MTTAKLDAAIEEIVQRAVDAAIKRASDTCTNAKVRCDTGTDFIRGWNAACRELCNAIFNRREVDEPEKS